MSMLFGAPRKAGEGIASAARSGYARSQGRRAESDRGSCSVLAALIAAALLLLAALVLQKPWRTYTNETLGFSVRYPLLWRAEEHRIVQLHTVTFVPWLGSPQEGRRLEIHVLGDVDESGWTSEDYMSFLKEPALADPRVTIQTARHRDVDGRPGAEMAVQMEYPDFEQTTAMWVVVCGTGSSRFMLGTIEVGGNIEALEGRHAQFVDSFRFLKSK